jgi:hypothetical protein
MPRRFHAMLAVLALALAPQIATAGLISFSYQIEIQGDGSLPNTHSSVEITKPAGSFTSQAPWALEGIQAVSLHSGLVSPPVPGPSSMSDAFTVAVSITDTASGETGKVVLGGGYGADWEFRSSGDGSGHWDLSHEEFYFGLGPNYRQQLSLGGNEYDVWGEESGVFDQGGFVVVAATLSVHTPEPAALTIAGAGLVSTGLFRFRRRRAASN